ncbi:hypothetical protein LBMAG52_24570 [Planctomycetia bacterium]|nr:hypothetical protein LBMAG52_24570 [Planctomycetia bacterium]
MTWHIHYTHQCGNCEAFYIPYEVSVLCPKCGTNEDEVKDDFISEAAGSAHVNLREGSYLPGVWHTSSFADHILYLLFSVLEQHRTTKKKKPFDAVAREAVDRIDFEDQEYLREHLYEISLKVKAELDKDDE